MNETLTKPEQEVSKLSIDQIWKQYHIARANGNGEYCRNLLIEHYRILIRHVAKQLYSELVDNVELDDLIGEGVSGLIEAIEKFSPKRRVKFETYAFTRIKGSILDYLRREDWATRHIRLRYKQLEKAKYKLKNELGYEPTEEQLLKELSKDSYPSDPSYSKNPKTKIKGKEKAKLIIKDAKNLKTKSYSFPLNNLGEEDREAFDGENRRCLENKKIPDPLCEEQKKDFKSFLYKGLTRQEKLILNLYYANYVRYTNNERHKEKWKGMPQSEIAKLLEVCESRVSQIHSPLLLKLKDKLTAKGLTLETCLNNL